MSSIGLRAALLATSAIVVVQANPALAQSRAFDVQAQPASSGITAFADQADIQILVVEADTRGRQTRAVRGTMTTAAGLQELLAGSGLSVIADNGRTVTLSAGPQSASAGGDVDALIVTAQKREENIQDVPIAISAFSQEDLTTSQIAGGPDLITQVPNMTFTKTNFSSYSVQLRGIGTQAISATTDPAVAVAFNNTPFIRNRFFEQEFYDLQRIEVLRGPQGTLYGRNATAGVVNIISAKPKFRYEAKASGDAGNFNSRRLEGMLNIPLIEDKVALRLAGAWTKRDGYATNEITGNPIDGRDLWSTRLSLRFSPTDRIDANLIWEHFEEDDDRIRSGKQLCKKDVVTQVGDVTNIPYFTPLPNQGQLLAPWSGVQATLSQGCKRVSLYSEESFQTPNGMMLPYYVPLGGIGLPIALRDPYQDREQSHDWRSIQSTIDPDYRAQADLGELQVSVDLTDNLTLSSETAYSVDTVYSLQDFNRFNTAAGAWVSTTTPNSSGPIMGARGILRDGPNGGIWCDPQLGCSDRLVAVDISTAKARQFSQEFRLSSDFDGAFNFSLGTNFLRADSEDKYYVFFNSLSLQAAYSGYDREPYQLGVTDNHQCLPLGFRYSDPSQGFGYGCVYMDPNPIDQVNDQGHNYFLSKNPYKLISYAVFGEIYYNLTDTLKVTGGLRWTVDKKEAPRIPSWTLAGSSWGYPVAEVVRQDWTEPTGRLAIDWKPDFSFTDETLLYASYAHGYKAGGANPPPFVQIGVSASSYGGVHPSETRPQTFAAEFVDAFELGAKNTLANGALTVNLAAFYYDYTDYQISEIIDRSAFNRNFDATVWGVELEADWRVLENLKLGVKGGYEKTRIADGERAIDLMDRTAGRKDWLVVRPFPTFPSSCVLPTWLFNHDGPDIGFGAMPGLYGLGAAGGSHVSGCDVAYLAGFDPVTNAPYVDLTNHVGPIVTGSPNTLDYFFPGEYPGWNPRDESQGHNGGEGFFKDLGGNELPNAPNWTATITADYTAPLPNAWLATVHTDLHWQSDSWWRVFQDHEYAKLDEYFTMNLAAIFTNEEQGWNIMAYVKNVTDETAITGAFLNSDDTGLTTNIFLTEPRLYGVRVTKAWTGEPWWGGADGKGAGDLIVEIGGQIQRRDAPYEAVRPTFAATMPAALDNFDAAQNTDLDWGDGRDLKLTYRPHGAVWAISAGVRFGRTNGRGPNISADQKTDVVCAYAGAYAYICDLPLYQPGQVYYATSHLSGTNFSNTNSSQREEHTVVDFSVGRDVGIGGLARSTFNAGLRYAQLKSRTRLDIDTVPDWDIPEGAKLPGYMDPAYLAHRSFKLAQILASHDFEGTGPFVSWEASQHLLGNEETGRVTADWSVGGGVLFGRQDSHLDGFELVNFYEMTGFTVSSGGIAEPISSTRTPISVSRSQSVTVPVAELSVGLSYEVRRIKIGAGYRWERYFDAVDAGFQQEGSYDRTIDGPYFKIAVGFGG